MVDEQTIVGKECRIAEEAEIKGSRLGSNLIIDKYTRVMNSTLGDRVYLEQNNHIIGSTLGRYCYTGANTAIKNAQMGSFNSISWNVSIGGNTHDLNHITTHSFLVYPKWGMGGSGDWQSFSEPCKIGNDVWVGAGANILRGVTIGDGAVIGASCVVTKDVPPYAIVVGNPGHILRMRCDENWIPSLLTLKWWDLPEQVIKDYFPLFKGDLSLDVIHKLQEIKDTISSTS